MILEMYENIFLLFFTLAGLFICLSGFVRYPKRMWVYITAFFLGKFLSDYHWAVYTLIMKENPEISEFLVYFGWNVSYLMLLLFVRHIQSEEEKAYRNPLIFLPVPINLLQLCKYLTFGGIFNNFWQVTVTTLAAMTCMQSILYYARNKKNGAKRPVVHIMILIYITIVYCMWTSSCYWWNTDITNPYYTFMLMEGIAILMIACIVYRTRPDREKEEDIKSVIGSRYSYIMRALFAFIIVGCCFGGYMLAQMIRMRVDAVGEEGFFSYGNIALMLFFVSVTMVMLTLSLMYAIYSYHRGKGLDSDQKRELRGKFNFAFTLIATFLLMLFAVIYMMRLLYRVSLSDLYTNCDDKVTRISEGLTEYLNTTKSVLWVTADTVDQMMISGVDSKEIHNYLRSETDSLVVRFDENYTGLYGYIDGAYMDGLDWEPPAGYDPTSRDWYADGIKAGGDTAVISPYVDLYTGDVIISVSRMLSDGKSVIALDVTMNHIQDVLADIDLGAGGYGMIVNADGLIVAHPYEALKGRKCSDIYGEEFMADIMDNAGDRINTVIGGENYAVFVNDVMGQWYTVVLVNSRELLSGVRTQMIINGIVYMIVFLLVIFFYSVGYTNERNTNRLMAELKDEKQKQDYEAAVLKLEKSVADQANQAKSRFLADMSHEIRTPINAVLGMNEMILREADNEDIREYARNIHTSGEALLSLINTILDFSKIEDGKMELVPVEYNTADLIRYLINSVDERARTKSLDFITVIDPSIPSSMSGDDMRLGQVIINLLTNAVKYTKEGSVTLTLKNNGIKDGRISLYAEVKDTGIGIKEEDRERLFESFERLETEKNRTIEGTGLGMSIVTKLLGMMGSELSLDSTYGVGSTFSFTVLQGVIDDTPVADTWKKAGGEEARRQSVVDPYSFTAPQCHVLVVDDTAMNLMVAKNLLKTTQMRIDTAASGKEALNLCMVYDYDVIFMDQRMPEMDGVETFHLIREQKNGINTDTPVICLTADAITGAKERYIAEGFAGYLTKPIDWLSMEKLLLKVLPAGKVIREETYDGVPASVYSEQIAALDEAGIDVAVGLKHCQDSEDIYRSVLTEYVKEAASRIQKLNGYHESKDWKNYGILVHALKSTSAMIGAVNVSRLAGDMEKAADSETVSELERNHEDVIRAYEKAAQIIAGCLDISVEDDTESDEEILEFEPEGE